MNAEENINSEDKVKNPKATETAITIEKETIVKEG
jgi:hypothetical protein